jgi:hypothetical protein
MGVKIAPPGGDVGMQVGDAVDDRHGSVLHGGGQRARLNGQGERRASAARDLRRSVAKPGAPGRVQDVGINRGKFTGIRRQQGPGRGRPGY